MVLEADAPAVPLPLSLPLASNEALADRCRRFLTRPASHATIDEWADDLAMSRRTSTRLFRRQMVLSFADWWQRACMMAALPRLIANEPITRIALYLGYENPASFTAMFKRHLGMPPGAYRREGA